MLTHVLSCILPAIVCLPRHRNKQEGGQVKHETATAHPSARNSTRNQSSEALTAHSLTLNPIPPKILSNQDYALINPKAPKP